MRTPQPMLLVHYGKHEWIRGSERCLLDLIGNLDRTRFEPILWCDTQKLQDEAMRLGIHVYRDRFTILGDWEKPRFNINNTRYLVTQAEQIIQQHDIKLIHCNSAAPCQWMITAANRQSIPLVCHLHAPYPFSERLRLRAHHADEIICVNEPIRAQYLAMHYPQAHCHVVANGIDPHRLMPQPTRDLRTEFGLNEATLVMASIGSLIPCKGMDNLIHAVHKLKGQCDVALFIIGDGPEKPALISLINQLNVQHQVFLLGEQKQAFGVLKGGVDVFLSGAREEAFGLVLAEAGLAKLPCIAPNVGGISQVIKHQKTGLLYLKDDIDALCQQIKVLYEAPQLRTQLGDHAYHRVHDHFLISQNVAVISDIYTKAINNGRQRNTVLQQLHFIATQLISYPLQKYQQSKAYSTPRVLIIDTISFNGGSKIATQRLLDTISAETDVHVITVDPASWQDAHCQIHHLPLPQYLLQAESGKKYLLKHLLTACFGLFVTLRYRNFKVGLGCSIPSNDAALWLLQKCIGIQWIQFIHGPVYPSNLNAKLLKATDAVFYLESTRSSLEQVMSKLSEEPSIEYPVKTWFPFVNGLPAEAFTDHQHAQEPGILWAASALKWKGLDTFVQALRRFSDDSRPRTAICYIRPQHCELATSAVNVPIKHVTWHENPPHLNEIRAKHHIFVSTSTHEPFGLSILEALAANLCVVIPADGAYWDQTLTDGKECVKYRPNDDADLFHTLEALLSSPALAKQIGQNGYHLAQQYGAEQTYAHIKQYVEEHLSDV